MPAKTLEDMFLDSVKDVYFAERQIVRALKKMARAANDQRLKAAFDKHLQETEGQIERLVQVFELLEKPARGKTCPAINGILEEGEEVMEDFKDSAALDAGLIAAAQAVEHYEIARYGTLCAWGKVLGKKDVVDLLGATLVEETKTDEEWHIEPVHENAAGLVLCEGATWQRCALTMSGVAFAFIARRLCSVASTKQFRLGCRAAVFRPQLEDGQ